MRRRYDMMVNTTHSWLMVDILMLRVLKMAWLLVNPPSAKHSNGFVLALSFLSSTSKAGSTFFSLSSSVSTKNDGSSVKEARQGNNSRDQMDRRL